MLRRTSYCRLSSTGRTGRIGTVVVWLTATMLVRAAAFGADPAPAPGPPQGLRTAPVASPLLAPGAPSSATPTDAKSSNRQGPETAQFRRREGSEIIDGVGRFERRGDRVAFLMGDHHAPLVALENLALERVLRVMDEDGLGPIEWRVTGTLTEFRGANYLMIRRAMVKPEAGPPAPKPDGLAERIETEIDEPTASKPSSPPRF